MRRRQTPPQQIATADDPVPNPDPPPPPGLSRYWRWLIFGATIVSFLFYNFSMSSSTSSSHHVVVIGGGLAGMSAAFAAHRAGAFVTLVDKEVLGGNSAKATSGANAVNTRFQAERADINDSVALFMADTAKSGHGKCDPRLVHVLAAQSGSAINALAEEHGLELSDIEQLGGHSAKRTHRFPPKDGRVAPVGWTVISKLKQDFAELVKENKAALMERTSLIDMAVKDNAVVSLVLRDETTRKETEKTDFTAVVFAAGGYAADSSPDSLLAKHRPDLIGFPTTNGPFARGETTLIGLKHGLKAVDIDEVQLHPTGFVHPDAPTDSRKFLCPEVIRGVGAILVDPRGRRFVNELKPRDMVSQEILTRTANSAGWRLAGGTPDDKQRIALLVLTEQMAERFGMAAFNFYKAKGFFFDVSDAQKLRDRVPSVDPEALLETIREYDMAAAGQVDDPFGKTVFPQKFDLDKQPTLYGAFVTPSLHFSMGGLAITPDARAVDGQDRPLLNLFVAGENAGGIHGGNRLGGNGCLESMVFGRLAGRFAARAKPDAETVSAGATIEGEILAVTGATVTLAAPRPNAFWPAEAKIKSLMLNGQAVNGGVITDATRPGLVDVKLPADEFDDLHPGAHFVATIF